MRKTDPFSYDLYGAPVDAAGSAAPEVIGNYIPDEIFTPFLETLQARAPDLMPHIAGLQTSAAQAALQTKWDWARTCAFTQAVWEDLNPRYGAAMGRHLEAGVFVHQPAGPGLSRGFMHPAPQVEIFTTGTIEDPICAVHESGHLMAAYGPDEVEADRQVMNVAEIQSMFAQEHSYHCLKQHEAARTVEAQRLQYYLGTLQTVPVYLWQLEKNTQPAAAQQQILGQAFRRWAMNPALASSGLMKEQPAQALHLHPFAALVTPVLYRLYQAAAPRQQAEMLSVLYEQRGQENLPDLLSAFGVRSRSDVQAVATLAVAHLAEEVRTHLSAPLTPDRKKGSPFMEPPLSRPI